MSGMRTQTQPQQRPRTLVHLSDTIFFSLFQGTWSIAGIDLDWLTNLSDKTCTLCRSTTLRLNAQNITDKERLFTVAKVGTELVEVVLMFSHP